MVDVTRLKLGWVLWVWLAWLIGCDGPQASGNRMYVDSGGPRAETCATTTCHRDATCSEDTEGPSCACNAGFSGDGFDCDDIDECANDDDNCDVNATCANTEGSFTCTCNAPAWQGNGTTCGDADECADNTDDCSANASCINTVGSFTCECALQGDGGDNDSGDDDGGVGPIDAGISMDGGINMMCRDIDECATNTDDCDPNATCINNDNGFSCECNRGYTPTGTSEGHGINGCTFAYCDLTGRWAVKTTLVVSWGNVLFNNGTAIVLCSGTQVPTYAWELRDFDYDGTTLKVKSKGCGSTTTPVHNRDAQKFAQYIPYSMFDAVDLRAQEARELAWPTSQAQPDSPFVPPYESIVFGMRVPNPDDPDAWPTRTEIPATRICGPGVEPPCWEDDDRDPVAAPGYTTWSYGPMDNPVGFYSLPNVDVFDGSLKGACYTLGSRTISRFNGTFDGCDRIAGDVDVMLKANGQPAIDARLHGCKITTSTTPVDCYDPVQWNALPNCTGAQVNTLDRQTIQRTVDSASFEMVRVSDTTECPDVRDMFPVTETQRDYCECGGASVVGCN